MESAPDLFSLALVDALVPFDVHPSDRQLEQMLAHFHAMIAVNETVNLTRITDPLDAAVKHYADSLALLPWSRRAGLDVASILDIGTGPGFPALPVAVMRPDWSVIAVDAARKKCDFLAAVARDLDLQNLRVLHAHSDHWSSPQRFNLVVARAVGSFAQCMEIARPFLLDGGSLVAYKTAELDADEMTDARRFADTADMTIEPPFDYQLRLRAHTLRRSLRVARFLPSSNPRRVDRPSRRRRRRP